MSKKEGAGGDVVGLAIGAILLGTVGMQALNLLFNADTTGLDPIVITLITTVTGLIIAIGFLAIFMKKVGVKVE